LRRIVAQTLQEWDVFYYPSPQTDTDQSCRISSNPGSRSCPRGSQATHHLMPHTYSCCYANSRIQFFPQVSRQFCRLVRRGRGPSLWAASRWKVVNTLVISHHQRCLLLAALSKTRCR
jgi:hypothetical protein